MRRILVVANQTLGGDHLAEVIRARAAEGPLEVLLMVPATHHTDLLVALAEAFAVQGGMRPPTESYDGDLDAKDRAGVGVTWLTGLGASATGEVVAHDPLPDIRESLTRREVDEVIVSTLPAGVSRWPAPGSGPPHPTGDRCAGHRRHRRRVGRASVVDDHHDPGVSGDRGTARHRLTGHPAALTARRRPAIRERGLGGAGRPQQVFGIRPGPADQRRHGDLLDPIPTETAVPSLRTMAPAAGCWVTMAPIRLSVAAGAEVVPTVPASPAQPALQHGGGVGPVTDQVGHHHQRVVRIVEVIGLPSGTRCPGE